MNSSSGSGGAPWSSHERGEVAYRSRASRGTPPGTRPSPCGRRPGSRRRRAGCRGPSARAGCTRRSAPTAARSGGSRGSDDVVLDDHVGLELVEDLAQAVVDVARAVDQRLPGRLDEPRELLDRRLAEDGAVSRMKSFQNWPGSSSTSGGGPSRMRRSSKPCASRFPANDSSTTKTTRWPRSAENVADADAVVRRPECALGEEDDGRHGREPSHGRLLRVKARSSVASVFFDELADR